MHQLHFFPSRTMALYVGRLFLVRSFSILFALVLILTLALFAFARTALASPLRLAVAWGAGFLWIAGVNELVLLTGGAILVAGLRIGTKHPWAAVGLVLPSATAVASVNLLALGAVFLKAGALL